MLFEYLNSRKVPINGQAEKSTIISRVLEFWANLTEIPVAQIQQTLDFPAVQTVSAQEMNSAVLPPIVPEMGLKFTQWFYEILLAVHKQTLDGTKLCEQFWRDVRLKITLNSIGTTTCQEALGSDEVSIYNLSSCFAIGGI